MRTSLLLATLLMLSGTAHGKSFVGAPILESAGLQSLNRSVTRAELARDLFGEPYDTAVLGSIDVYDRFPYLESRWFQIVSDPAWDRLLAGEVGGSLTAHDGAGTAFGRLDGPRGVAADASGRIWVADTDNHRVLAFDTRSEYGRIELVPLFAVTGLSRPFDVAFSDGGTPFAAGDDRIYVADTGANRVVAFDVTDSGAREAASLGGLGSGPGRFAGPLAVTAGRSDGASTRDVYVADSHSGRIVRLQDQGDRFAWVSETAQAGAVTSLDTDHWGAVYAASPSAGSVTKYSADLLPVAALDTGVERPRAFHVPFANRTDHRSGRVVRAGQGSGLVVEEWTDASGMQLVRLGVEVKDLQVRAEHGFQADFVTTDHAVLSAEVVEAATGRTVVTRDLGTRAAGRQSIELADADLASLASGDHVLRITASSSYSDVAPGLAEASFPWAGGIAALPGSASVVSIEPNPFGGSASIRFAVPGGERRDFTLRVYDVSGRLVRIVDEGQAVPGVHTRTWNGDDDSGRPVAAGVYLVRLVAGTDTSSRKTVLLR
jgi:hypothetical protein